MKKKNPNDKVNAKILQVLDDSENDIDAVNKELEACDITWEEEQINTLILNNMRQENKELLLKDLCARLPYGVKVKVECTTADGEKIKDEGVLNSIFINEFNTIYVCVDEIEYELENIKPYLHLMSSMTNKEYDHTKNMSPLDYIDWLNTNYFDYRGLIDKGLTIAVTEDDNPYED